MMAFDLGHVVSAFFAGGFIIVLAGFALRHPHAFGEMLRDAEAFARARLGGQPQGGSDIAVDERGFKVTIRGRMHRDVPWAAVRRIRIAAVPNPELQRHVTTYFVDTRRDAPRSARPTRGAVVFDETLPQARELLDAMRPYVSAYSIPIESRVAEPGSPAERP